MKSKKNLQKVLCIALATASVSSAVAPVSCAVRIEDEIKNGLVGMGRDVHIRLFALMTNQFILRNSPQSRALVGVGHEVYRSCVKNPVCVSCVVNYNIEAKFIYIMNLLEAARKHIFNFSLLPVEEKKNPEKKQALEKMVQFYFAKVLVNTFTKFLERVEITKHNENPEKTIDDSVLLLKQLYTATKEKWKSIERWAQRMAGTYVRTPVSYDSPRPSENFEENMVCEVLAILTFAKRQMGSIK
ncbi:hypothetical protein FACS189481_3350 [Clostridia bacterium]|nr:hypothetical protein FACS189481_3350 [Clostridia bacterium]